MNSIGSKRFPSVGRGGTDDSVKTNSITTSGNSSGQPLGGGAGVTMLHDVAFGSIPSLLTNLGGGTEPSKIQAQKSRALLRHQIEKQQAPLSIDVLRDLQEVEKIARTATALDSDALWLLAYAYQLHFDDDTTPTAIRIKNIVAGTFAKWFGAAMERGAHRAGASEETAHYMFQRMFQRARTLDEKLLLQIKDAFVLEHLSESLKDQTGSNAKKSVKSAVIDLSTQIDPMHGVISYSLVDPSGHRGSFHQMKSVYKTSGSAFVSQLLKELQDAMDEGVDVVSISMGITSAEYRGDHAAYAADVKEISAFMEQFSKRGGVVVVAAGRGGPSAESNGLAEHPGVITALGLNAVETQVHAGSPLARHGTSGLGVGVHVLAKIKPDQVVELDGQTSCAAPQVSAAIVAVLEELRKIRPHASAQDAREIILATAEPLAGTRRVDAVAAVAFVHYLQSIDSNAAQMAKVSTASDQEKRQLALAYLARLF